jgi:hypothetical protein
MGVRLYPNTQTPASLELICGVEPGTMERLNAMLARHKAELEAAKPEEKYDLGYKQYCERQDDQDIGRLDHFLTFGWGKFNDCGVALDCAGHIDNTPENQAAITLLFDTNGITADPEMCEGVHWG